MYVYITSNIGINRDRLFEPRVIPLCICVFFFF